MEQTSLKEYLKAVVDTEKDLYLKSKLEESYTKQIYSLGKRKQIAEPKKVDPDLVKSSDISAIVALFFVFVLPIAIWIITASFLIGVISSIVCIAILDFWDKKKISEKNKLISIAAEQAYNALIRDYQEQLAEDSARVERENVVKQYLERERSSLLKYTDKTKDTLRNLYSANLIYPKYRNLSMVSSIYEYIRSGRCSTLGQAYNILENEIRLDKIITQLDQVITNLQALRNSQYVLYRLIIDANAKLEQINKSTNQVRKSIEDYCSRNPQDIESHLIELEKHSEATAYFAERTQIELAYMNRMNYLAGKNDGLHRNLPPSF